VADCRGTFATGLGNAVVANRGLCNTFCGDSELESAGGGGGEGEACCCGKGDCGCGDADEADGGINVGDPGDCGGCGDADEADPFINVGDPGDCGGCGDADEADADINVAWVMGRLGNAIAEERREDELFDNCDVGSSDSLVGPDS
jgi:hypothetical protein